MGIDLYKNRVILNAILVHKNLIQPNIAELDLKQIEMYFSLGFIPAPNTIFKRIKKLQAGENLLFDLSSGSIIKKYIYFDDNSILSLLWRLNNAMQ